MIIDQIPDQIFLQRFFSLSFLVLSFCSSLPLPESQFQAFLTFCDNLSQGMRSRSHFGFPLCIFVISFIIHLFIKIFFVFLFPLPLIALLPLFLQLEFEILTEFRIHFHSQNLFPCGLSRGHVFECRAFNHSCIYYSINTH